MTNHPNGTRLAVSLGLGLAAIAGQLSPVVALAENTTPAVAPTYGTGNLTIKNVEGNDTSFKAFQIFKANKNGDDTASNIQWASDAVKAKVLGVLDADGYQAWLTSEGHTDADAHDQADYAAQYIAKTYSDGTTPNSGYTQADQTAGNGKVITSDELLNKIAAAVDDVADSTAITAGTATSLAEGYWVAVTDSASIGENEDGTSPVFALVGTGDVVVTEKTSVPTLTKKVKNDAQGAQFGDVADSEFGQDIDYELTGTIASNYDTYDHYQYKFTDSLSAGLTINQDSVKVTIDGNDVTTAVKAKGTNAITFGEDGQTLTVDLGDLKTGFGQTKVTKDSKIVVDYKAKLDPAKAAQVTYGGAGNANTAKVTYSSNPNTTETKDTHEDTVYDHAFKLRINKVNRDTGEDLAGAKFTIQATGADEGAQTTYVQADGSLGATAYEFTTDDSGLFAVSGLDAGTYTVHETQAPEHYRTTGDFTFTIAPTYAEDGSVQSVAVTTAGNGDVKDGIHENDGLVTDADAQTVYVAADGQVNLTVGDVRNTPIPVTGLAGVGGIGAGLAIVIAAKFLNKRDDEDDDEE